MIDINVLLYMSLSAVLTGWIYDHWLLRKEIAQVVNDAADAVRVCQNINKDLNIVHNESAKVFSDLARKVSEMGNKVELLAMHSNNKKMFNETKK